MKQSQQEIKKYNSKICPQKNENEMQSFNEQKQINQSETAIKEKSLLQIIDKVNEFLNKFDEIYKQNLQVVILVGIIGNGKSTIFNFLRDYEFMIEDDTTILKLKYKKEGASKMNGGSKLTTKEPTYFFHKEHKHILIDFPGFQDTGRFLTKQVIKILFNRINLIVIKKNVNKPNVKIVYVVQQNGNDMLYNRGKELHKLIKHFFPEQKIIYGKIKR